MSTPAERQRIYRERQARGVSVVGVEVSAHVLDGLVKHGWITEDEADDPKALADVLSLIVAELSYTSPDGAGVDW